MKIGAKTSLLKDRWELVKKLTEVMDFIEVYYTEDRIPLSKLLSLDTRWVVHGPHIGHGINLAKEDPNESNIELFEKCIVFAHDINARYIITHAGYCSLQDDKEVIQRIIIDNIKRLKKFSKQYRVEILIENSIFKSSVYSLIGFFSSEKEIGRILKKVKCKFLLDFCHAYITSLNKGENYKQSIYKLMKFKPKMFHLCDGIMNSETDRHMTLGNGNYDLRFFLSLIKNQDVTLEISPVTLESFLNSKEYIQKILRLNSKT